MFWNFGAFLREIKELIAVGIPMTINQAFYGIVFPVTLAFCGALGTDEIDQASLAISIYQLFILSLEAGFRFTVLSFAGQILRTDSPHRVGIFLQRACMLAVCFWLLGVAVAANAANLLILIGQIPSIAIGAERFLWIIMPGCFCLLIYRILIAYLDALNKVIFAGFVQFVFCALCFTGEYVAINVLQWGVTGVAITLSVCQCILPFALFIYIVSRGIHKHTWRGWSTRCFTKWGQFVRFLISTVLSVFVFFCATELGVFIAGNMGKEELAAQSITFQIYVLATQLPFGFMAAGIVRMTRYIGCHDNASAKLVSAALLTILIAMSTVFAAIIFVFGAQISQLYSSDAAVLARVAAVIYYMAGYAVTIMVYWGFIATFRAYGQNKLPLMITGVSFFLVGYPIALPLIFGAGMKIEALWIGYTSAGLTSLVMGCTLFACKNWNKMSTSVMAEVGVETEAESAFAEETVPLVSRKTHVAANERVSRGTVIQKLAIISGMIVVVLVSFAIRVVVPPVSELSNTSNQTSLNVSRVL